MLTFDQVLSGRKPPDLAFCIFFLGPCLKYMKQPSPPCIEIAPQVAV